MLRISLLSSMEDAEWYKNKAAIFAYFISIAFQD